LNGEFTFLERFIIIMPQPTSFFTVESIATFYPLPLESFGFVSSVSYLLVLVLAFTSLKTLHSPPCDFTPSLCVSSTGNVSFAMRLKLFS